MKKFFYLLPFVCYFVLSPHFLFAQKEGLISKIENPTQYFQDDRRTWVGRTIYFLSAKTSQIKNPYFAFMKTANYH